MFILGLDGLDYDLVKELDLQSLLQEYHGSVKVPISKRYGFPHSPDVWASFLTGKWVDNSTFERRFNIILKLADLFGRGGIVFNLGLKKKLQGLTFNEFPALKDPTFPIFNAVNVPYLTYDHQDAKIIQKFIAGKINIPQVLFELDLLFVMEKNDIRISTQKTDEIIFAYLRFPDIIQHLGLSKTLSENYYKDLNIFASELQELKMPFLIISDHGFNFETGMHSMKGFYSSNFRFDPEPTKITDFYSYFVGLNNWTKMGKPNL